MPPRTAPFTDRRDLLTSLVSCALEAGLSHSDAVRLGVGVYQEIDILARDESFDPLSIGAFAIIRDYALSIIRSGSTFSPFEIATRAVAAWRLSVQEFRRVNYEWKHERATKRRRTRSEKQKEAARLVVPESKLPAPGRSRHGSVESEYLPRFPNPDRGLLDIGDTVIAPSADIEGFDDLYTNFNEMRQLSYDAGSGDDDIGDTDDRSDTD